MAVDVDLIVDLPDMEVDQSAQQAARAVGRGRRGRGTALGKSSVAVGIRAAVSSVIAGPTRTGGVEKLVYELLDKDLSWDEAQREFMRIHRPQSLLQRLIEPEEIAHMVVMVVSLAFSCASATTGGTLRVDGGYADAILP